MTARWAGNDIRRYFAPTIRAVVQTGPTRNMPEEVRSDRLQLASVHFGPRNAPESRSAGGVLTRQT